MRLNQAGIGVLKLMSRKCIDAMRKAKVSKENVENDNERSEGPLFEDYFSIINPRYKDGYVSSHFSSPRALFSWIMDNRDSQFTVELKRAEPDATCQTTVGEVSCQVYDKYKRYNISEWSRLLHGSMRAYRW